MRYCKNGQGPFNSARARYTGLDIGARPPTQASSKMVGQVQIKNHMPSLASMVFILAQYVNSKLTSLFTFHLKIICVCPLARSLPL